MHQAQWSGAAAVSAAASARAQPCCAGVRGGWRWCRRGRCTLSCGSRFLQTWACPGTPYSGHSLARGMRRTHRSGSCAVQSCERTSARRREARRKNDSLPLLQHHLLPPRPKRAVEARQWRSLVVEAVGGERGGEGSPPPPPPAPPPPPRIEPVIFRESHASPTCVGREAYEGAHLREFREQESYRRGLDGRGHKRCV